jgi:glycolate oxidase
MPATFELMDQTAIACIEEAMHLGLPTDIEALLLIETDGADQQTVQREIEACVKICQGTRGSFSENSPNEAERVVCGRLAAPSRHRWRVRLQISSVKISRYPAVPFRSHAALARHQHPKYGLPIVIFGHAGDGNLHPNILFDKRQPEQWAKVEQMVAEIFEASLAFGGSLSGEHGVGSAQATLS